jgi:hypothetical protein
MQAGLNYRKLEESIFWGPLPDGGLNVLNLYLERPTLCHSLLESNDDKVGVHSRPVTEKLLFSEPLVGQLSAIGREKELAHIFDAFGNGYPVEIWGEGGIGKDYLLSYLLAVYQSKLASFFPDGVISPLLFQEYDKADLLNCLFNHFYESSYLYKPSPKAIAKLFENKKALIIIDQRRKELNLSEFNVLQKNLPECNFLFISNKSSKFSKVVSIQLAGLSLGYCVSLVERYLGFSLSPIERRVAEDLCRMLAGNPRDIIQSLVPVRLDATTLLQVSQRIHIANHDRSYILRSFLKDDFKLQERILSTLFIFPDYGLTEVELSFILGVKELKSTLESLRINCYLKYSNLLVTSFGPFGDNSDEIRYKLSGNIAETIRGQKFLVNIDPSLNYFLTLYQKPEQVMGLSLDAVTPLMALFKQSLQQSKNYSGIVLGNVLSDVCLSHGCWGIRKAIILEISQVTLLNARKARLFFDLGLQEVCTANYQEALKFLNLASKIHDELGNTEDVELIDAYKKDAVQKLTVESSKVMPVETIGHRRKLKRPLSYRYAFPALPGQKFPWQKPKINQRSGNLSLRLMVVALGTGAIVYSLLNLIYRQFQSFSFSKSDPSTIVAMNHLDMAEEPFQAYLDGINTSSVPAEPEPEPESEPVNFGEVRSFMPRTLSSSDVIPQLESAGINQSQVDQRPKEVYRPIDRQAIRMNVTSTVVAKSPVTNAGVNANSLSPGPQNDLLEQQQTSADNLTNLATLPDTPDQDIPVLGLAPPERPTRDITSALTTGYQDSGIADLPNRLPQSTVTSNVTVHLPPVWTTWLKRLEVMA